MTVAQLKAKAKELGIVGIDGMKKAELEAAIAEKESESVSPDSVPAVEPKSESDVDGSSSFESDFAKHPKFAKFNSRGEPAT